MTVASELCSVLGELLSVEQLPPSTSTSYQFVAIAPGWYQIRVHDSVARELFGQLAMKHGGAPEALNGHDSRVDKLPVGARRRDTNVDAV